MNKRIYYFNVPGYTNSKEKHWQSIIEKEQKIFVQRINQKDWNFPNCKDWVSVIDTTLADYDLSQVVLIGHSLGCATIVHWLKETQKKIKAAIFVAPADVDTDDFKEKIVSTDFSPMPLSKLDCFSIVVASEDDEWVTLDKAKFYADKWNSKFVNIGKAGHVNATSGYGAWGEFYKILDLIPK